MHRCPPLAIRSDPVNADLTLHYLIHCTTYQVENTWSIMSTKLDPDGWQYTTRLDSAYWYPQNDSSLCKCLSMHADSSDSTVSKIVGVTLCCVVAVPGVLRRNLI
jgi:hypothetical protein